MRIVTGSAGYLALLEALRSFQRLYDKCRLPEAAVLVKTDSRELAERDAWVANIKPIRARVVQFAGRAGRADGRLHMALPTDAHEVPVS